MVAKKQLRSKSRKSRTTRRTRTRKHKGGAFGNTGYTFNQSDVMGGQMARVGYSHCDTPEYVNTYQIYDVPEMTPSVQPLPQVGGKRSKKSKRSMKSKKSKRTKRARKQSSRK
jgi:hypothetical protein